MSLERAGIIVGILSLALTGCEIFEDPKIGKGQKQPEPTLDTRPTQGPPVLAVDRTRHIWHVSTDELTTVCLGNPIKVKILRIGRRGEEGTLVGNVFSSGFGDSHHEDYSLGGFINAYEGPTCSRVTPTPTA